LLQKKRLRFAGHCAKSPQPVANVLLAETSKGKRPRTTAAVDAVRPASGSRHDGRRRDPESHAGPRSMGCCCSAGGESDDGTRNRPAEEAQEVHPATRCRIWPASQGHVRRINALKAVDDLICAARTCDAKACRAHCTLCRHSFTTDDHDGCPILTCKYCKRVTAATCAGSNRAQVHILRHSFVCKDCSHLLDDLR